MIHEVLTLIVSVAIFFQGFSFRRRNMKIMLVSSFIVLLTSGLSMILNGIDVYVGTFSNVDMFDVTVSLAYVLFWFVSGYIVGGFQRVTTENMKVIKVR